MQCVWERRTRLPAEMYPCFIWPFAAGAGDLNVTFCGPTRESGCKLWGKGQTQTQTVYEILRFIDFVDFLVFFPPLCRPCLFCQPVVRQQQCLTKMVTSTGAGRGVHMFAPNIPSNGSMEVSYKIIGFNIILKWSNDLDGLGAPVNLGNLHINVRHAIEDKIN